MKIEVTANQAVLIPSGYLHAVLTLKDSFMLGGSFVHEYSIRSHLHFRKMELHTNSLRGNRYQQFGRFCWLLAQYYADAWAPNKGPRPKSYEFLQQIHHLRMFIELEVWKIQNQAAGWKKCVGSLPWGWREDKTYVKVIRRLKRGYARMSRKMRQLPPDGSEEEESE
ncbi:hypothetical protein QFC24_005307 [Naganishia onofrii]|uniref:Uncharacterized protein n=1 Tax=Naganishia onofrii TaxID=1851511 RepID=A0ACC2X8J7_9TREE|nr:hypothetical protein QFC24_005307 [Naganishia onofrii]